jgi:hypothetical protein
MEEGIIRRENYFKNLGQQGRGKLPSADCNGKKINWGLGQIFLMSIKIPPFLALQSVTQIVLKNIVHFKVPHHSLPSNWTVLKVLHVITFCSHLLRQIGKNFPKIALLEENNF